MFNKQMLKEMISERLSETAEEIFLLFEQAVAEYQREIDRLKTVSEAKPEEDLSLQQTETVGSETLIDSVLKEKSTEHFPYEVKTEPPEEELQVCLTNVKTVNFGDELKPHELKVKSERAETENNNSSESEEEETDTENDEEPPGSDSLKNSFSCSLCQVHFPHRKDVKVHVRSLHPGQEPLTSAELSPSTTDLNSAAKAGIFSCKVCDKQFKLRSSMKKHMKKHADNDPFRCTNCSVTFTKEAHFIRHMKNVHSVEKPFSCSFCHKPIKTTQILRAHILVHTGERPFKCSVCGKGFVQKGHLRSHMFTHTGDFHGCLVQQVNETG